jgi:Zn-dependent protease
VLLKSNFRLGNILGIPVLVNPTWLPLALVSVWALGWHFFPGQLGNRPTTTYVVMALASVYFFFMSILFHELAHGLVAKAFRIPVQSITLFLLGGVAQVTREATRPLAELLMAIVGPLMSLAIGAACYFAWQSAPHTDSTPIDVVLHWLARGNVFLAAFNLVPAFPMDGGRVLRSLLWLLMGDQSLATSVAAWTGRFFGWCFMAAGFLALAGESVDMANGVVTGAVLVLVGLFLENATRQSLFQNRVVIELRNYEAQDLMLANPPIADAHMTIGSLARGILEINPRVCYLVEEDGRLAGILSAAQMRAIPESQWEVITAGDAMTPTWRLHPVAPSMPASDIILDMERSDITHLPVVDGGDVVGVVGHDRIIAMLERSGHVKAG